ncbi:MAG: hypothetical protein H6739_10965 [Alphaproteobacteria bacterium]|nr:hypothetical protein [Alphaproteobacteria bacterium]
MKRWRRRALGLLGALIAEEALKHGLAASGSAAVLMAAGPGAHPGVLLAFAALLSLRILLFVAAPPVLLGLLVGEAVDTFRSRKLSR